MLHSDKFIVALSDAGVEYVIIGGVAAVAHGSAHSTLDLDLCYARTRENCARLAQALAPFRPSLRGAPAGLPFYFDAQTIWSGLNFTLSTTLGDLDLLGEVAGLGFYPQVRAAAEEMELFERKVWVLGLEGLICTKRTAGRPKDLRALPELEALAALKSKKPES